MPPSVWEPARAAARQGQTASAAAACRWTAAPWPTPTTAPATADSLGVPPPITVSVAGRTVDIQAYTTFLRQLAASPWFTEVSPQQSSTVIEADRPVTQFNITLQFRQADSVYLKTVPLIQSVR